LLFPGDSIDRAASLKKIAARVLNRVNAAKAHPGMGAPAWLLRIALPRQNRESLLLKDS
jgi:hypothetical protein